MGTAQILDVVLGIFFLLSVLVGYHRGLIVTLARVAAVAGAYMGAVLAATGLKSVLAESLLLPLLERQTGGSVFVGFAGQALREAAEGIAYSLVFFIAFAILQFILFRLAGGLKTVDKIPVVGGLDKLGGAVLGFCWIFFLCLLLGNVFFTYVPKELRRDMGLGNKVVKKTVLLSVFVPDKSGK